MNDLRAVLPPGYSDRAVASAPAVRNYDLRIPIMYSNKNPSWQQLTINEADVLEPEVFMPRLNPNEIFQPEPDDVALLEREVNAYRSNAYDDELEELQRQRRLLLEQMQDVHNDDLEDQLNELNNRIRIRQQELEDYNLKKRMIEEENRRIELELQRTMQVPQRTVIQQVVVPAPRQVVVERPRRAMSPGGLNILPNKIDKLPEQVNTQYAYGYVDGIPIPIGTPGQALAGSTTYSVPPQNGLYGNPNGQFRTSIPASNGVQAQPIRTSGTAMISNGGYTTAVQNVTPVNIRSSGYTVPAQGYQVAGSNQALQSGFQPPLQQVNPYTSNGIPAARVSAGTGGPIGANPGTVYKINGQTYTSETLPPQYANLRR